MRAVSALSARSILCFVLLSMIAVVTPIQAQEQLNPAIVRPLITEPIDESRLTTLKGNTHPLARPQFDLGTADGSLPMKRMLLVLKRSDEQEATLRKLLDDQQDKHSPNYHKWLTPGKFGQQFGPTDADMQTITVLAAIARLRGRLNKRPHRSRVLRDSCSGRRGLPHHNPQLFG